MPPFPPVHHIVFSVACGLSLLGVVVELIRRSWLQERHAALWIVLAVVFATYGLWSGPLVAVARWFRIGDVVTIVLFFGILLCTLLILQLSVVASQSSIRIKNLVQEVSNPPARAGTGPGAGVREGPQSPTMKLFDPAAHEVRVRRAPRKIAVLSIDVEHDYNGGRTDALDRLPDLLRRRPPPAVDRLRGGAPVRGASGSVRPSRRGRRRSAAPLPRPPGRGRYRRKPATRRSGLRELRRRETAGIPGAYRAHTYRLTEELVHALLAERFAWDSSILPGIEAAGEARQQLSAGDRDPVGETVPARARSRSSSACRPRQPPGARVSNR